jgi:hypothetical protein
MTFRIQRDQFGQWTAWPRFGAIIGPCATLDSIYRLVTQQHGTGCTLEVMT